MAKREYISNFKCDHEGCKEWGHYYYTTRKDQHEGQKRRRERPWKCVRHSGPRGDVLSMENRSRTTEIVLKKSDKYPDHDKPYWHGVSLLISGFAHGLDWKAFQEDFPEGTIIKQTVQVILPGSPTETKSSGASE